MKQLGGLDATFLYMETEETPMHVAGLTLYELPEGFKGSFANHFRDFFASRLHLVPIFSKKLARTVFELDHPGWVDAGEVDLEEHILSLTLDKPGTFAQLEQVVADLHSQPLDRRKPLWQFVVIEGLEDGKAALYSKVHHAAVDGGAGMVIAQALYDLSPTPREVKPPKEKPSKPKRKPSMEERAILGVSDFVNSLARHQLNALEAMPKAMIALTDALIPKSPGGGGGGGGLPGLPDISEFVAPKTPFNKTISSERTFAARSLSLVDAKAIGKATGSKINDVVMAVCSGALRSYLQENGSLPRKSLIAFVPISLREAGNTDINNQVFGMNCRLATNVADPLERLQKIQKLTSESKAMAGGVKDIAPRDYTLLGAPYMLPGLMQLYGLSKLADIAPQAVNLTISNTMGPPFPMYCAGAKVLALYPVSIPIHGVGLNITVQSYFGSLDFGITAAKDAMPDPEVFVEHLSAAMEELKAASAAAQ